MPTKGQEQIMPSKATATTAGGSSALASFEAPALAGVGSPIGKSSFPAQSSLAAISNSVAQLSTIGQDMPGLDEPAEKGSGKRKKEDEKKPEPERRETRASKKPAANLNRPSFSFTAAQDGVNTQKLDTEQAIGFVQQATLTRPANAVNAVSALYNFRQQVCDTYHFAVPDHTQALGAFVQDGPYRPDYDDGVIGVTNNEIVFNDNPGFSTDAKVQAGSWLETYEVRFRWLVSRRDIASGTWTSPVAINQLECLHDAGNDVDIDYTPADDINTEVVIPDA
jgi:hypothetical protein